MAMGDVVNTQFAVIPASGIPYTFNFGFTGTAGNLLVVLATLNDDIGPANTPVTPAGWTLAAAYIPPHATASNTYQMYYRAAGGVSSVVIDWGSPGTNAGQVLVVEYDGTGMNATFSAHAQNDDYAAVTERNTGSVAVTTAQGFAVAGFATDNGANYVASFSNGFVETGSGDKGHTNSVPQLASKVVTESADISCTGTMTALDQVFGFIMALELEPEGGGGTGTISTVSGNNAVAVGELNVAVVGTNLITGVRATLTDGNVSADCTNYIPGDTEPFCDWPWQADFLRTGMPVGEILTFIIWDDTGAEVARKDVQQNGGALLWGRGVTDISRASDEFCFYYNASPGFVVGDKILQEYVSTLGDNVDIDALGFPVFHSDYKNHTDRIAFWPWDATDRTYGPTRFYEVTETPALSLPYGAQSGSSTADLSVETSQYEGAIACVVTTSATPPSAQQILDGLDHTGAAAAFAQWGGETTDNFTKGRMKPQYVFARNSIQTCKDHKNLLWTYSANQVGFNFYEGVLLEGARTNLFLQSETPATQNVTVSAQAYSLSFYGEGSIALSGAHTATLDGVAPYPPVRGRAVLTFTPAAGALTLTITGDVQKVMLEVGAFDSSYIPTTTAAVTRVATSLTRPWRFPSNNFSFHVVFRLAAGEPDYGNKTLLYMHDAGGANRITVGSGNSGTSWLIYKIVDGTPINPIPTIAETYSAGERISLRVRQDSDGLHVWWNDNAKLSVTSTVAKQSHASPMTSIEFSAYSDVPFATIESLTIWNEAKSDEFLGGLTSSPVIVQPINLDSDIYDDTVIYQSGLTTITEDTDSINIDTTGDGIAEIVLPKGP